MNNNLFTDDLEYHYVVSCRDGKWDIAPDVESSVMPDGTIYDYKNKEWLFPTDELRESDLKNFSILNSALRQLNEGV